MLILTRKQGESIDLVDKRSGEIIASVMVLAFLPNGIVRLGFDADSNINIIRDDMIKEKESGNQNESVR